MEAAAVELVLFGVAGATFLYDSISLRSRKGTDDGPDAECFTLHMVRACWVISKVLGCFLWVHTKISVAGISADASDLRKNRHYRRTFSDAMMIITGSQAACEP